MPGGIDRLPDLHELEMRGQEPTQILFVLELVFVKSITPFAIGSLGEVTTQYSIRTEQADDFPQQLVDLRLGEMLNRGIPHDIYRRGIFVQTTGTGSGGGKNPPACTAEESAKSRHDLSVREHKRQD